MYLLRRIGSKQETGRSVRDRMVVRHVQSAPITTKVESCSWRGVLVQHYVIKFVSDLRQVGGFLQVLRFPPSINPTATI
jgi:hypothetical protein